MRDLIHKYRPSSGVVYLVTFLLFAALLLYLQEQSRSDACESRNELRMQFAEVQDFDDQLRHEVRDYLVLRLSGDREKIAEGVRPLRAAIRDLEALDVPELKQEDC